VAPRNVKREKNHRPFEGGGLESRPWVGGPERLQEAGMAEEKRPIFSIAGERELFDAGGE